MTARLILKYLYSIYLLAFFVGFIDTPPVDAEPAQDDTIHIAFIAPFSGTHWQAGVAARNGFEYAIRKNKIEGIQVHYEDDGGNAIQAQSALRNLLKRYPIKALVSVGDETSNPLSAIANKEGIIAFTAGVSDALSSEGLLPIIQSSANGIDEGKLLANEVQRRGYKKIAVIYSETPYHRDVLKGFRHSLAPDNPKHSLNLPADDSKIADFVKEIAKKGVTALGLFVEGGKPSAIARIARKQKIIFDYFGLSSMYSREELRLSRDFLLGAWFVTPELEQSFVDEFSNLYQGGTVMIQAGIYHDIALTIHKNRTRITSPENFARSMVRFPLTGGALSALNTKAVRNHFRLYYPLSIIRSSPEGFSAME